MISHEHRAIFVHIQKTGGESVTSAFGQSNRLAEKHVSAQELRTLYGQAVWNSYFKFSIVRNPWDRLVSWWSMIDSRRGEFNAGRPLNKFQTYILRTASTFEEFILN